MLQKEFTSNNSQTGTDSQLILEDGNHTYWGYMGIKKPIYNKLLVLDIDETLIYATETKLDREPDFRVDKYNIYKRPYLDTFIEKCATMFTVGIWTTAGKEYAEIIINTIFLDIEMPVFIWTRDKCIQRYDTDTKEEIYIVDIKKLVQQGYKPENIIFVDDAPDKMQRNYGNAVIVNKFTGNKNDAELPVLLKYLQRLGPVDNIRTIDKRNWQDLVKKFD